MAVSISEQETVIQIDRETGKANIYTSDARVITKLDKIYDRTEVHKQGRSITAVEYQVPEKLISFRKGTAKRKPLTEAEKKRRAENMKKVRARKA